MASRVTETRVNVTEHRVNVTDDRVIVTAHRIPVTARRVSVTAHRVSVTGLRVIVTTNRAFVTEGARGRIIHEYPTETRGLAFARRPRRRDAGPCRGRRSRPDGGTCRCAGCSRAGNGAGRRSARPHDQGDL